MRRLVLTLGRIDEALLEALRALGPAVEVRPADEAGGEVPDLLVVGEGEAMGRFLALTDDPSAALERRLAREFDRARRYRHPLSLVVLQVPGEPLALLGDGAGAYLDALHAALAPTLRGGDRLVRSGPRELLAVLPETDLPGARIVAERLRAACRGFVHKGDASRALPVKAEPRVGIAEGPREGVSTAAELLLRARAEAEPAPV